MHSRTPKLLHPLCGRPAIAWLVAAAREAGAGKVVVVDAPGEPLAPALDGEVEVAIQAHPRGTADALQAAAPLLHPAATVISMYGDAPLLTPDTLRTLAEHHAREGAAATMLTMVLDDPSGYGRVVRGPDGTVERVAETKVPGDASELELQIREVNTGVFAFNGGALLDALPQVRAENAQGERYLPDVLPILRAAERTVVALELADHREVLAFNDRRQLAEVRELAQARINERHMLAGVTLVDPRASVIDVGVSIGPDTEIAPFTSLLGATVVGRDTRIGPHTTLIDTKVGDGVTILHSHVVGAVLEDRVSVGPFAYLRPGTVLREGSKAGTFVEIKNSDVGAGTKVPHLSYVGDADIGPGGNLGASTITANYHRGVKNRTTIGARVRTSVDTTLVAPVTLGDGAYTGAGSVITHDVPPGALAIARERQRNIENYAARIEPPAPAPEPDSNPPA